MQGHHAGGGQSDHSRQGQRRDVGTVECRKMIGGQSGDLIGVVGIGRIEGNAVVDGDALDLVLVVCNLL